MTSKQKPAAAQTNNASIHQKRKPGRVQKVFTKPSLTKQAFAKDANINTIMAKYQRTGQLPISNQQVQYLQNSGINFHEAMQLIAQGKNEFEQLPANIRAHFDNKPERLIEFLTNEQNIDQAVEMGLVEPPITESDESQEDKTPGQEPPGEKEPPGEGDSSST